MSISLTENAAQFITKQIKERKHGIGVRLLVKSSGCSGLAYHIEFVDSVNEFDFKFVSHSVTIVVDSKSFVFLDGVVLDFVKEGLNKVFKFNNPNEKKSCGCGESFSV
jgi:iron-sulfur cluster assembly protein